MWPGDLAPDHADLGAADLLLGAVDIGDLLALVEAGSSLANSQQKPGSGLVNIPSGVGVVDALNLDEAGARLGGVTRALVAQVTSPIAILSAQIAHALASTLNPSRNRIAGRHGGEKKLLRIVIDGL